MNPHTTQLPRLPAGSADPGRPGALLVPSKADTAPQSVRPNRYSDLLYGHETLFRRIEEAGGLIKICCPSAYPYDRPPYLIMPAQGRQYQEIDSISLPPANSTDTLVHQFTVPDGYDGVITSIVNFWTGTGFVEGSGDLTWRIMIGRAWARDLGEIETTLGSLASPCPLFRGGIRLKSNQLCRYYVNHRAGSSLSGGRIVCGFFGWFYPV